MKSQAIAARKWSTYLMAGLFLAGMFTQVSCQDSRATATAKAITQTTFAKPSEAGVALEAAARAGDQAKLTRILGPNSQTILSSGDPAEDKAALHSFVSKYQQLNRWVAMGDGTQILNIGADSYPFPIPLAKNAASQWYFDTKAGEDEILARQIGRNELLAIDACNAIANAEELYFRSAHDERPAQQYATMISSNPGTQDGLHWSVSAEPNSSPEASLEPEHTVSDGYSFRILTGEWDKTKDSVRSYVVKEKLTGGFAVIASPVIYRDSGVMTFIISREGVVYEKDLGPDTVALAAAIKDYNPTDEWTEAE